MSMTYFILSTISLQNNLELNIRNSSNIRRFKSRIKESPIKSTEYYSEGSTNLSILYTRLRCQCRSLNSDLFHINITNDPKCQWGAAFAD